MFFNMFLKRKPKVTQPKEFGLMLMYNGYFKPTDDDRYLLFEFQEWGYEDFHFIDDFRDVLTELMADLCGNYQTAVVIKSIAISPENEIGSVKIGKGANVLLIKEYFNNWSLSNISTNLYVISSDKEILFKYESRNEYIKKLLEMLHIIRFDVNPMYNASEISVDISMLDKEVIVESVKKICARRKISLDISINYRKLKSEG